MSRRNLLPFIGQMSTFSLSLASLKYEDPLINSSQECKESRTQNHNEFLRTSNYNNGPCVGQAFYSRLGVNGEVQPTFSSLPCLMKKQGSAKCDVFDTGHNVQGVLSAHGKKSGKQGFQVSSKDKRFPDNRQTKVSPKQSAPMDSSIQRDGKYGWIVVFGAFLINMIIDGICLSFGIFYTEFLDYFQQGQAKTAWTGSVLSGTYSLLGKFNY